ncbi:MAG TPA: hypothetical protein GX747_01285 [Tenericutes bacterium]|nr:hypothetical protein [Mycoplasmatota bacterium]
MNNVEKFKEFVRKNPSLIKHVRIGDMTWQKFYEIFNLYGENNDAWKDYITSSNKTETKAAAATAGVGLGDFISMFKGLDLDGIQSGVSSIQRVLSVLQDFSSKDSTNSTKPKTEYKPRPLYKHFED